MVYIVKMRYSGGGRYRKYIEGYGFLSFSKKFKDKCGKKLMDMATKTGIKAAKTDSKKSSSKNNRSNRRFHWK